MGTRTGRPRGFDRDAALERAMLLFWERGYDTVSVRDLTDAMEITPPSLYAAFTDKQTLFEEAVDTYAQRYGGYIREAFETQPTAYRAVRGLLTGAAVQQTLPGRPSGCLILNGATNHTVASAQVAAGLRARRAETEALIEGKIRADIDVGELPPETDAPALTAFATTVWQGLSQLARDGHGRRDLEGAVAVALAAWPGARQ
ncbi:TetR/AcrR family transcriptional regulator [Promicromonospora aerolata]|uniref:TetR/AcrR family transcriptional regulator n=1 Tax=Promicromonospora aerolata TaxID=195749 RepID=A0ABW4V5S8_9MICO